MYNSTTLSSKKVKITNDETIVCSKGGSTCQGRERFLTLGFDEQPLSPLDIITT
jgi:hypothetical protein